MQKGLTIVIVMDGVGCDLIQFEFRIDSTFAGQYAFLVRALRHLQAGCAILSRLSSAAGMVPEPFRVGQIDEISCLDEFQSLREGEIKELVKNCAPES